MSGDERNPHTERETMPEHPAAARRRRRELSRRDFLRLSALATGVFGAPMLLTACGAGAPAAPAATEATAVPVGPQRGGTLVLASYDADTLDPHYSEQTSTETPFSLLFDQLVARKPDGGFEGRVAESWTTSDDGLTLIFTIREGITFHDGTPLDAAAVAFSVNRITESFFADTIAGAEVTGDREVTVTLLETYAPILSDMSEYYFAIVSPTAVAQYGDDFGRNPVGSGAYRFKEWVPGERIVVERYDGYREFRSFVQNKETAYFDEVIMRAIPEAQTLQASLETGEVHIAGVAPSELGVDPADVPYTFIEDRNGIRLMSVRFTMQRNADNSVTFKPPFDDLRLRQAVGHAINNEDIIAGVVGDGGVVNRAPVPYGGPIYSEEIAQEHGFQFDPQRANQLLDEAGWTLGGDGVRTKDGQALQVSLYTNNSTERQRICELIQNQLSQVGFDVSIQAIELGSFLDAVDAGEANFFLINNTRPDPDMLYTMTDSDESGVYSYQEYNPEFAALVSEARTLYAMEERVPLYHEAQRLLMADPPFIPLLTYIDIKAVRPEVQGVTLGQRGIPIVQDAYFVA